MDVDLTAEQRLLQRTAREVFTEIWSPAAARSALDGAALPHLQRRLAEVGFLGMLHEGGETLDLCLVAEQAGRVVLPSPLISAAARAVTVLRDCGGTDRTMATLTSITDGSARVAVVEGDLTMTGGTVSGRCHVALDAQGSTLLLTRVRRGEVDLLLAIPSDAPGVTITAGVPIDATRRLARVTLAGVTPEVLAEGPGVSAGWDRAAQIATVVLAAEGLGTTSRCVELGVEYAKNRHAFGRTIGSFQAIKHSLVDIWVAEEMLRSLVWLAAWTADADPAALALCAAAAKSTAADTVERAAETLIQVQGGIGFTWEHDAHLLWRRAKVDRLLLGDAASARDAVARLALAQPAAAA